MGKAPRGWVSDADGARPGPAAAFDDALRETLKRNLAAFNVVRCENGGLKPAAVCLCAVDDGQGQAAVLVLRRAAKMNRHAGQYALPGGRADEGETDVQAALRELREELGLDLAPNDVLGRLDDFVTASGYRIAPIAVWGGAAGADLKPAPGEVELVFRVPFSELLSPDIPHFSTDPESGDTVMSAPLPAIGHHIFAPTAAILYQFREAACLGRETRVADMTQPSFARR
ncbi:MAG: NUDIX hydrolase [Rhodospirillales bacterium]